ncbi:tape measure protein, partial [Desulfovibrio porci]|uniref:tape measure protein n=1 Tax=Desulfovibrio porci TaxID=2605782 RepID=UPI003A8CEB9E
MGDTRGALSSLGQAAGAAKLAIAAWGAAVLYAGKACLDAQIQMQRLEQSYKAVFGAGAGAQLQVVYEQTNRVGLKFLETAEAAKSFFASGQGTSLAPQLNDIFKAVTNAGAALQLSTEQVNGTFIALGQMMSKGKVQAEELRGQLGERLPGAFQMAAQAMGMTTAELDKFMADGKLTAEDLLPKLAEVLEEKYARAAENAANTVQGSINRMSTEWERFKAGLVASGPAVFTIQFVTEVLKKNNDHIDAEKEREGLKNQLAGMGIGPDREAIEYDSWGGATRVKSYSDELLGWQRNMTAYATATDSLNQQWQEDITRALGDFSGMVDNILKNTAAAKKKAIDAQREDLKKKYTAATNAALRENADADLSSINARYLAAQRALDDKEAKLGKKGAAAAKAAAVAQANYTGEVARTRQQIDSLQQQLVLDRGEDLTRAKIRIEQQYQAILSKTSQELDNQVTRGTLTRAQAEALKLEKGKAAALQMQVSLRDAEQKAQEKSVHLAEGQLKFYKERGELSGDYGDAVALQNKLIEMQAREYKEIYKISDDLVDKWVELQKLQVSTDPFDGAYRGLLKFNAEFADSGAQWEGITHGFASNFNSATKDMFDDFLDNGRVSFDDMGQLFKQLLKDMAYQALIQPVVLSVVNGAAGMLYGSTTVGGGMASGGGGADSFMQAGTGLAQQYATNQLMGGSGGMFGGIANSINSGVAGMFPTLFAPTNTLAAAGSAVNAIPGMAGSMPTSTFTGMLSGAGLAGGLGSLGYGLLGGAIGLPQSQYSGITSGIGSALGYMGGSTLGAS